MLLMFVLVAVFFGGLMTMSLIFGGGDGPELDHDVDTGSGAGGESGGWSGWFSIKVMAAFGTAFGAAGALALVGGAPRAWALAIAALSGVVIGYSVKLLTSYLKRQEMSGSYNRASLAGQKGTMICGAINGGIGEAQFIVDGQMVNMSAKSTDGKSISQGEQVVVETVGSVLLVSRVK